MRKINDAEFIAACERASSMSVAAAEMHMHFNTFRRFAVALGCYRPDRGQRGIKNACVRADAYKLEDILAGKYPQYSTFKLKQRLLQAGLKQNKCEICALETWRGALLQMELHHKDGDRTNHALDNLQIICPNCHAQTTTFRAKNK